MQSPSISDHGKLSSRSTPSVASRRAHAGMNFPGGGWYLAFLLLTGALATGAVATNDNFAGSVSFTNSSTNFVVDNALATTELEEPLHPPPAAGHTLWWTWFAPGD